MKSRAMLFIRILTIIVVLGTCLAMLPPVVPVSAAWDTDQTIDNSDVNTQWPDVAMDGKNAVAAWVQFEGDQHEGNDIYRVYSNYSSDGGNNWHVPQLIENNTQCEAYTGCPPRVAISGQNVVVVWQQLNTPGGYDSIFANYSSDGGKTWHDRAELDNNTEDDAYNPYVDVDGNHAVAIWFQYWEDPVSHHRYPRFFTSSFDFTSPGWSQPVMIENNPLIEYWNYYDSRVAIAGQNVVAIWEQRDAANKTKIYGNYSTDYGVTWQPDAQMIACNTTDICSKPGLDIAGGSAVAVWQQGSHIYSNYFITGLASWMGNGLLDSDTGYSAGDPDVALSGGTAVAVWQQNDSFGRSRIFSNRSSSGGYLWQNTDAQTIDDIAGLDGYAPKVGISGSNVFAVWFGQYGADYRIYSNASGDSGVTWNDDPLIEDNSGQDGRSPEVAVSGSGAVAVWQQGLDESDPPNDSIYSNVGVPSLLAPEVIWINPIHDDLTDLAVGDLNGDTKQDVAAIDDFLPTTLFVFKGEGSGSGTGSVEWDHEMYGYSVAVGDIDGDTLNEVIASGYSYAEGRGIFAFENDGTLKWFFPTTGVVKDIEIGDIDDDTINDVVACNNGITPGTVYAIDGVTGLIIDNIDGTPTLWPVVYPGRELIDVAVGQLDGEGGMDVVAIGRRSGSDLFALDSYGNQLWSGPFEGQTVEIGDVDGQPGNEVVVGTDDKYVAGTEFGEINTEGDGSGYVLVYSADGEPLWYFATRGGVTDVELGDLDGNPANGKEVAAITDRVSYDTLYALDMDNSTKQIMWTYPMSWSTDYYGESLAIGDVDRDYKNEVVACSSIAIHKVYAFDGIDKNGDGIGDLVFTPFEVFDRITDLEIGDLDGDGDQDIVFGTASVTGGSVYAIKAVDSDVISATGTCTAYFDADPSSLVFLKPVDENTLPVIGKPAYSYPHGFFSFEITGLTPYEKALVTVTLLKDNVPVNAPVGTKWVKYDNNSWTVLPNLSDDGDNVITFELADTDGDGIISDPGGPAYPEEQTPRRMGVGGEVTGVNKTGLLAPWIALVFAIAIGGIILLLSRRKKSNIS